MCLLGCRSFLKGNEGQHKVEEGCNLSCRFRSISRKALDLFQPYYTYMIPTCPTCAFWDARPSWRATNNGLKKCITCHVVSGAYLENHPTDVNHITHTWSPHALDVPIGLYDFLKVNTRSKKVVTCHVVYGVYLEKRSTDYNAVYFLNYSAQSISMPFTFFIIIYLAASMYIGRVFPCVLHVYFCSGTHGLFWICL
jgi:hypothetical protein